MSMTAGPSIGRRAERREIRRTESAAGRRLEDDLGIERGVPRLGSPSPARPPPTAIPRSGRRRARGCDDIELGTKRWPYSTLVRAGSLPCSCSNQAYVDRAGGDVERTFVTGRCNRQSASRGGATSSGTHDVV